MYRYGGVYYDYDTVMLQDFRPLMEFKHFVYRRAAAVVSNVGAAEVAGPSLPTHFLAQGWQLGPS